MKQRIWIIAVVLCLANFAPVLQGQDTLSQQVLRLLIRNSSWPGTQTFSDLRVANAAIPSITTYRIYADPSGNLYFNGTQVAGTGGAGVPHNLLSTTHPDTVGTTVVRGDVIIGNSTPAWTRLARGASGYFLFNNGTDVSWNNDGTQLINLNAANLTGTIAAVSGVNLTNLNASNLASGTVNVARLANIANGQIAAAAGIAYSKLNLAGSVNQATDIVGTTPLANGGTGLSAAADDTTLVSNGTIWQAKTLPDCNSTTSALGYTQASNTFSCIVVAVGTGTVTSAGLSMPAIFSVANSPVTTSATLTVSLANENANLVWAGPSSGAAAAPSFRALVSADIPVTFTAGSLSSSTPYGWTQTWNSGGTTFRGLDVTITDTASAAASTIFRLLGGGAGSTTEFSISKGGNALIAGDYTGGAGTSNLGTTALPFLSVVLGTAATNNLKIQPAAFAAGVTATVDDPVITSTIKLPLVRRGTVAFASTTVLNGKCSSPPAQVTITGLATTAAVIGSLNFGPPPGWASGLVPYFYPTANTLNLVACNPSAGSIAAESVTFNYATIVP